MVPVSKSDPPVAPQQGGPPMLAYSISRGVAQRISLCNPAIQASY